jgi:hypothetical protein
LTPCARLTLTTHRTPLVAKFNDPYVPATVLKQLQSLFGSHAYSAQAVSPPWDNPAVPRNYTSWTAPGLSLGAIASDEKVIGGAATNQAAYVPASIIWSTGTQTAWFNVSSHPWFLLYNRF